MKVILFETKFLSNPVLGKYTITRHYTDGTVETSISPSGPIIIPERLDLGPDVAKLNLEANRWVWEDVAYWVVIVVAFSMFSTPIWLRLLGLH